MYADNADPLAADDGLGAALAAVIEAIDHGERNPHSILARYPEYAAELRDLFVGQERAERVPAPLRPVVRAAQTPTLTNGGRTAALKGLEKEPARRYRSAEAVAEEPEKVTADFPDRATDRSNLGAVLDRRVELLWKRGERQAARRLLHRAGEHHRAAQNLNPAHPVYRQLRDDHRRLVTIARQPASSGKEEPPRKE